MRSGSRNHFSKRSLRAPGEPISKAISLWWQPTDEKVPSVTQLAAEKLRKGQKSDEWISNKIKLLMHEGKPQDQAVAIAYNMAGRSKVKKANSSERKSTVLEYGSQEEKEKELSKKPGLPNLFSGERGPKHLMQAPPPVGVPHSAVGHRR